MFSVLVSGSNWILFMHEWFCPIHLISLKSLYKNVDIELKFLAVLNSTLWKFSMNCMWIHAKVWDGKQCCYERKNLNIAFTMLLSSSIMKIFNSTVTSDPCINASSSTSTWKCINILLRKYSWQHCYKMDLSEEGSFTASCCFLCNIWDHFQSNSFLIIFLIWNFITLQISF